MSEILLERPKEYLSLAEIAGIGNEGRFLRISPDGTRVEPVSLLDLRDVGIHGLTTGMVRLYEDGSVDGHSGQAFTRRGIIGVDSSGYVTSVIAGYDPTGRWWFNPDAKGDKLVWASGSPGPDWTQVEPGEAVFGKGLITSELLVTPIDWQTQIAGPGKPEDNATLGATWGSNIDGQPDDALLLNELNGIGGYQGVPLPNEGGRPVPIDVYITNSSSTDQWFKVFEVDLTSKPYGVCSWNGIFSWGASEGRFSKQMRTILSILTNGAGNIYNPKYRYSGEDLTARVKLLYDGNICQVWVFLSAWQSCLFDGVWTAKCDAGKSWIRTSQGASDGQTSAPTGTFVAPEYNYELGATVGAPDATPLGGMTVQDSVVGDGVFFTANGIEGWKSGSRTFLLDATTGDAIFSGTITAAVVDAGQLLVKNGGNINLDSNSTDIALLGFSYEGDVLGSITAKNAAKIDFSPDFDNQRYLDIGNTSAKWKEIDIYAYEMWVFGDYIRFYTNNPPIFPYGGLFYYTSTPATYAGGGVLFLDSSDGRLKMCLDDGTIKVISWS